MREGEEREGSEGGGSEEVRRGSKEMKGRGSEEEEQTGTLLTLFEQLCVSRSVVRGWIDLPAEEKATGLNQ